MKANLGKIYVFLGCALLALSTIISHRLIQQNVHPLLVAFYAFIFSLSILIFIKHDAKDSLYNKISLHWQPALILNISTAVDWIIMFIALQYINASLLNCFIFGVSPLATLFLSIRSYTNRSHFVRDLILTLLIGFILLMLANIYYQQVGAGLSRTQLLLGVFLGTLSGIATAITVLSCKALSEHGFSPLLVLKSRYVLLIISAYIMLLVLGIHFAMPPHLLFVCLLLAIFYVVLPALLVQKGLETTSSVAVVILCASIPAMTYCMQLFDSHYHFDLHEFTFILLLCILICIATLTKGKQNAV